LNKHIEENLKHYISIENPEYAVLLSGKWGSGKTYFINKYVKENIDNVQIKFLKISLFGLSKVTQIDEIIFQKLHPVLGHKYAKMTGSMLKSALKIGLNFDSDGDGKSDGRLTIDPKEFAFFSDDKKSTKELIFIFDDLERTSIELSEILGYINYLVEQSEFKVIILANEEEIKSKDNFNKFKEKIIGKTFEVQQDLDATFDTFINIGENAKDVLYKHKTLIKNIFIKAKYNNLRHIRQTILDFEYFYTQLEKKFQEHDGVMKNLVNEFFIFSIEIKGGALNHKNFNTFDYYLGMLSEKTKDEETPMERIFTKYSLQNEYNILLKIKIWKSILLEGHIKQEEITNILNSSKYFIDEHTESWNRLWNYRDLEDDEFKKYLEDVSTKFYENKYKDQGKLLHVIALLLYFSKCKMYNETQKNIMMKAKENIKNCIESEKWDIIDDDDFYDGGAYSLGFFDRKSKYMQEMMEYLEKEIKKSFDVRLKDKAKLLLNDFKNNNLENLEKKLQSEFYGISIFSKMNVNEFVSMMQQLEHENIYDITQKIKRRYASNYDLENILSEEKFWKLVNSKMLKGIKVNDKPVKYKLLKSFQNYVIKVILENFQNEKECLEMRKTQQN